jgi:hypothetical protein
MGVYRRSSKLTDRRGYGTEYDVNKSNQFWLRKSFLVSLDKPVIFPRGLILERGGAAL